MIWKLGFAACSTLTLGWLSRRTGVPGDGCTGGGIRGPPADGAVSSPISAESNTLLPIGLCVAPMG